MMTQSLSNLLLGNKIQKLDPNMSYAWMWKTLYICRWKMNTSDVLEVDL